MAGTLTFLFVGTKEEDKRGLRNSEKLFPKCCIHSLTLLSVDMLLLTWALVALACCTASVVIASPGDYSPLTGPCEQSETQIGVSGSYAAFVKGYTGDLGYYHSCKAIGGDWCGVELIFRCFTESGETVDMHKVHFTTVQQGLPVLGICVTPRQCYPPTLIEQLQRASIADPQVALQFQATYGRLGGRMNPMWEQCNLSSYATMTAMCETEYPSWRNEQQGVRAATMVFVLLGLVLAGTLLCRMAELFEFLRPIMAEQRRKLVEKYRGHLLRTDAEKESLLPSKQDTALNLQQPSSPCDGGEMSLQRRLLRTVGHTWSSVVTVSKWFDLRESVGDCLSVTKRGAGTINTQFFEGIRVIAMLVVVYGHTIYFPQTAARFVNVTQLLDYLNGYTAIGIWPGLLAVDTFFYLSGFLFMHIYMKTCSKKAAAPQRAAKRAEAPPATHQDVEATATPSDPLNAPEAKPRRETWIGLQATLLMYVHRYMRMTPVVAVALITATWLLPYLTSGPLGILFGRSFFISLCRDGWWHQLLYIQNMKLAWGGCVGWFWYLACDMQLFLAAPFIAGTYYIHPLVFITVVSALAITGASWCCKEMCLNDQEHYWNTWERMAPYMYGMLGAVIVRSDWVAGKLRRWWCRTLVSFLGFAALITIIHLLWEIQRERHEDWKKQAVTFICEFFWGPALLAITIPWALGHNGPVANFLSHPVFCVLSKLTFGCYILHPIIMVFVTADAMQYPVFTPVGFYHQFAGYAVWAFVFALIMYAVVEYPFAQMNNALTKRAK